MLSTRIKHNLLSPLIWFVIIASISLDASNVLSSRPTKRQLKAKVGQAEPGQPSRSLGGSQIPGKPLFQPLGDDLIEDPPTSQNGPDQIAEKAESRFEKLKEKMKETLERMATPQDLNVDEEVTLENICDPLKINDPDSFIKPYIVDQFKESTMNVIETALSAKSTLQVHFDSVNLYSQTLAKFNAELVQKLSMYFESSRIKTVIYFVSSMLTLAPSIKLGKSKSDPLLKKFVTEITTYTFSEKALENQSDQMIEIYKQMNQGDPQLKKYYTDMFPLAKGEVDARVANDKAIAMATCSVILGITRIFVSGTKDPAFVKLGKIQEDLPSTKSFLYKYFEAFKPVFWIETSSIGLPTLDPKKPKNFLENCNEFATPNKKYLNLFGFISFLKVGKDLSDPALKFEARSFFTKSTLKLLKEANNLKYRTIVDFDLFVMYCENDSTDDMFNFLLSYQTTFVPFNYNLINDIHKVPYWTGLPIPFPSDYHLSVFTESKKGVLKKEDEDLVQATLHVNKLLSSIYLLYVFDREIKWTETATLKEETEAIIEVYKRLFAHWTDPVLVDKIVENNIIKAEIVTTYYLDILNYLCTKIGNCGSLPNDKIKIVIKKYVVVVKTVITITTYAWSKEFLTFGTQDAIQTLGMAFTAALKTVGFTTVNWYCVGNMNSKDCKETLDIYNRFVVVIDTHIFKKLVQLEEEDTKYGQPKGFFATVLINTLLRFKVPTKVSESSFIILSHFFKYILINKAQIIKIPNIATTLKAILIHFKTVIVQYKGKYDHLVFFELFNTVFGEGQVNPSTGGIRLKVSVTLEHVKLIEDFLYQIVVPDIGKMPSPAKEQKLKALFTILKNISVRVQKKLDPSKKIVAKMEDWLKEKAAEYAETPDALFESIIKLSRVALILRTNTFFKSYNVGVFVGFKSLREYSRQNPLTVIYNFFILAAEEAVNDHFEIGDMAEHLLDKIKGCMVKNGGVIYDVANLAECPWSFRKYGELYYFVLYSLKKSVNKGEMQIVDYYQPNEPLVHIRIFVTVVSAASHIKADYLTECNSDEEKNKPLCLVFRVLFAVWDHVDNTDTEAWTPEEFIEVLRLIFDPLSPEDKVKFKFILLAVAEVLTYMTTQPLHYDRYLSLFDTSRASILNKQSDLKSAENKGIVTKIITFLEKKFYIIDPKDTKEVQMMAIYLRRTFSKIDYNTLEKPSRQAVSSLMASSAKTLELYFKFEDIYNMSLFKIVLAFAYGAEYDKIALFLAQQEIFLQIPKMNNPAKEETVENFLFLMACPDIKEYEDEKKFPDIKKSCGPKIMKIEISESTRVQYTLKFYKLLQGIYGVEISESETGIKADTDIEIKQELDISTNTDHQRIEYGVEKNIIYEETTHTTNIVKQIGSITTEITSVKKFDPYGIIEEKKTVVTKPTIGGNTDYYFVNRETYPPYRISYGPYTQINPGQYSIVGQSRFSYPSTSTITSNNLYPSTSYNIQQKLNEMKQLNYVTDTKGTTVTAQTKTTAQKKKIRVVLEFDIENENIADSETHFFEKQSQNLIANIKTGIEKSPFKDNIKLVSQKMEVSSHPQVTGLSSRTVDVKEIRSSQHEFNEINQMTSTNAFNGFTGFNKSRFSMTGSTTFKRMLTLR